MGAFDTSLTPVATTPSVVTAVDLDPNNTLSAFIYVDIANIGAGAVKVNVGIKPSGGSVHWKLFELVVPAGDALDRGPWFIQAGDVVTVQTDTADDVTVSLTGVQSSA